MSVDSSTSSDASLSNPNSPFIKTARFMLSAPSIKFCPENDKPEFCLAGRSNVGKSSIVNAITNRKKLAKTSNMPGKTREMNYFLMNESWYLVDLPGYGYAKVSKKEQERWKHALGEYFEKREDIRLVIILVDIRHKPQESDLDFMFWLASNEMPFACVLNKSDKVNKKRIAEAKQELRNEHKAMNVEVPIIVTSAGPGGDISELENLIQSFL
ncbi:MAG: ribosome biogenesis GTP-binding protein YihA/YsxC [Balneolia bacterium]|nr:ribosome biogenesis GTP-binding protein YihA/YsxC [Balneolia bacterium]